MHDDFVSIATSARIMGHHVSAVLHHRFGIPTYKDSERLREERMLATPVGSQPLLGWARGLLSVPLRTGYPRVQASQDNGSRLPAGGCHVSPRPQLHPPGSRQLRGRHVPPWLWLPPPGQRAAPVTALVEVSQNHFDSHSGGVVL
jgi:hypothetical protein